MTIAGHSQDAARPPKGDGTRWLANARFAAITAGVLLLVLAIPSPGFRDKLLLGGLALLLGGVFLPAVSRATRLLPMPWRCLTTFYSRM